MPIRYSSNRQGHKNLPSMASKIEATLKGKNLLPKGANSFLEREHILSFKRSPFFEEIKALLVRAASMFNKQNVFY